MSSHRHHPHNVTQTQDGLQGVQTSATVQAGATEGETANDFCHQQHHPEHEQHNHPYLDHHLSTGFSGGGVIQTGNAVVMTGQQQQPQNDYHNALAQHHHQHHNNESVVIHQVIEHNEFVARQQDQIHSNENSNHTVSHGPNNENCGQDEQRHHQQQKPQQQQQQQHIETHDHFETEQQQQQHMANENAGSTSVPAYENNHANHTNCNNNMDEISNHEEQQQLQHNDDDTTNSVLLHRRNGINLIADDKFNNATWDDVGVNPEKGEATTLFGLDLQAIRVHRLKRLMGVLEIKGRKKFQNSKYDMFRCIYDHWVLKKRNQGGEHCDVGGQEKDGISNETLSHAAIVHPNIIVPYTTTASVTTPDGITIQSSRSDADPLSTTAHHDHLNHEHATMNTHAKSTTTSISESSNQVSNNHQHIVSLSMNEKESLHSPVAESGLPPTSNFSSSSSSSLPTVDTTAIPSSIATLALAGLTKTTSTLTDEEKQTLLHKTNERIESEINRAEKKLKIEEEKTKIDSLKERREQQLFQMTMMESLTTKIDGLRRRKREKDYFDVNEGQEIDDLIRYYINTRKRLMSDRIDGNDAPLLHHTHDQHRNI